MYPIRALIADTYIIWYYDITMIFICMLYLGTTCVQMEQIFLQIEHGSPFCRFKIRIILYYYYYWPVRSSRANNEFVFLDPSRLRWNETSLNDSIHHHMPFSHCWISCSMLFSNCLHKRNVIQCTCTCRGEWNVLDTNSPALSFPLLSTSFPTDSSSSAVCRTFDDTATTLAEQGAHAMRRGNWVLG